STCPQLATSASLISFTSWIVPPIASLITLSLSNSGYSACSFLAWCSAILLTTCSFSTCVHFLTAFPFLTTADSPAPIPPNSST
ncbi:unnamed protein product, partial [Closterium sp. NIES-53]